MVLGLNYAKSSFSAQGGNCIEAALGGAGVYVRDDKYPGKVLNFTEPEWESFLLGVKAGEFDIPVK